MPTVIHSFSEWLPQTQTWSYNQLRYLPSSVNAHVVCETVANLEQFPIENLRSPAFDPFPLALPFRILRRLGRRDHQDYLAARIRQCRADIVHSHFGDTGWADRIAVRRTGARHVVTFYGFDVNLLPRSDPRWRDRYRDLFRDVGRVLCEGPFMARSVRELGCPADRTVVHHLGVAVDEIAFRPRTWNRTDPLRVLMAATFAEKKGLPYGIRALGVLSREFAVELTLIGDARDQPRLQEEKRSILAAIEDTGLGPRCRLLGYQPHHDFFKEAYAHDLFLSPSVTASDGDTEGGAPVSLIEMAASGMPIVSTVHCDVPEVIVDGVTGHLAAERDVDGLVAAIRRWLDRDSGWEDMLQAGRVRVEREFDARKQAERLGALYADVPDVEV